MKVFITLIGFALCVVLYSAEVDDKLGKCTKKMDGVYTEICKGGLEKLKPMKEKCVKYPKQVTPDLLKILAPCEDFGCKPEEMKNCSVQKFPELSTKFEEQNKKSLMEFYNEDETKAVLLQLCNEGYECLKKESAPPA